MVKNSRTKPKNFEVICCENQELFKSWTEFLSGIYVKKCPFKSRPVREIKFVREHPRMALHRDSYNGSFTQSVIIKPLRKQLSLPEGLFHLPPLAYDRPIPITRQKYQDLQHLKQFCSI